MASLHPYLREMLSKTDINYRADDNGNVYMIWGTVGGRDQLVMIQGSPDEHEEWSDFDVWSPVASLEDIDAEGLLKILDLCGKAKMGGASIKGGHVVVKVDLPLGSPPEMFRDAVSSLAIVADLCGAEAEGWDQDKF